MAAKVFVHYTFGTLFMVWWIAGMVLAKGFWSTFICITLFPWSLYLVVEKAMGMFGLL